MIRKILPVLLAALAFIGGAVGGEILRGSLGDAAAQGGSAEDASTAAGPGAEGHGAAAADPPEAAATGSPADHSRPGKGTGSLAWYRFPQQFFVPIIRDGRLDSTMVLTLSLETDASLIEKVNAHEIKLRDVLLRQLLIHANTGGFDGNFTADARLRALRATLLSAARDVLPETGGILIGDIARQER